MDEIGTIINKLFNFSTQPDSLRMSEELPKTYSGLKNSFCHLTSNDPFELTYLHGIISKCYGCDKKYTDLNRRPPFDLIIKHLEVRPRYNPEKKEWYIPHNKAKSNAYYHLEISCVQRIHPNFRADDINITAEFRHTLSNEHLQYLSSIGINS